MPFPSGNRPLDHSRLRLLAPAESVDMNAQHSILDAPARPNTRHSTQISVRNLSKNTRPFFWGHSYSPPTHPTLNTQSPAGAQHSTLDPPTGPNTQHSNTRCRGQLEAGAARRCLQTSVHGCTAACMAQGARAAADASNLDSTRHHGLQRLLHLHSAVRELRKIRDRRFTPYHQNATALGQY